LCSHKRDVFEEGVPQLENLDLLSKLSGLGGISFSMLCLVSRLLEIPNDGPLIIGDSEWIGLVGSFDEVFELAI